MQRTDQQRLVAALDFALEAHGDQKRKGKDVPYVSHLLQVAGLVFEYGGDPDLAIAALLHDVREDCPGVTDRDLRERFGPRVADVVNNCTDLLDEDTCDQKSEWGVRKNRYIQNLSEADTDTRLVAICDKIHNLSNMLSDFRAQGIQSFQKFSAGPEAQIWYFEQVRRVASEGLPEALVAEFDLHISTLKQCLEAAD